MHSHYKNAYKILFRGLQRSRTKRRHKEIYYKELVHGLVGADKPQDLHLANWRPRRAVGGAPKA